MELKQGQLRDFYKNFQNPQKILTESIKTGAVAADRGQDISTLNFIVQNNKIDEHRLRDGDEEDYFAQPIQLPEKTSLLEENQNQDGKQHSAKSSLRSAKKKSFSNPKSENNNNNNNSYAAARAPAPAAFRPASTAVSRRSSQAVAPPAQTACAPLPSGYQSQFYQNLFKLLFKYRKIENYLVLPDNVKRAELQDGILWAEKKYNEILKENCPAYVINEAAAQSRIINMKDAHMLDLEHEFVRVVQQKEKWEASVFLTEVICFVLRMLEKVNNRWNNLFGFSLSRWPQHFKSKLICQIDLLYELQEKYKNKFWLSEKIVVDKNGNVRAEQQYPELRFLSFMAQDIAIYHIQNKIISDDAQDTQETGDQFAQKLQEQRLRSGWIPKSNLARTTTIPHIPHSLQRGAAKNAAAASHPNPVHNMTQDYTDESSIQIA